MVTQRAVAAAHVALWHRILDEFRGVTLAPDLRHVRVMDAFRANIEDIRRRALEKMDDGAVTAFYRADRNKVIDVLNEVLATETVCTLRYRSHYFMAKGIHSSGVEDEFLEHAQQEQDHADRVAKRITELGGGRDH